MKQVEKPIKGAIFHKEVLEFYVADMKRLHFFALSSAPPEWRFFRFLGFSFRPPIFRTFLTNFIYISFICSVLCFISVTILFRFSIYVIYFAVAFGVLVGIVSAYKYRKNRQRLAINDWNQYLNYVLSELIKVRNSP